MKLVIAVVLTLATLMHAVPHRRSAEDRDEREPGEIGQPAVVPETDTLPEDGDNDQEKRFFYSYESSSYSSIPNTPAPPAKPPVVDHAAEGGTGKAGGCDGYPSTSTMCIAEDDPDVTEYGLSPADKKFIVDYHNEKRALVPAKNMVKMYWDDNMAVIAQKLAQSCYKGHDSNAARKVPGYGFSIGQNWGGGMNLSTCLHLWHKEGEVFTYNNAEANKGKMIGHYTQMVNAKAIGIGCGFAYCWGKSRQNIVCNYAFGQTKKEMSVPYTKGTKGALCAAAAKDKDGLCDFGKAKYCFNGGKLKIDTGKCKCIKPYTGEDCSDTKCFPDDSVCGTGTDYIASNCKKYSNLVSYCPVMCGAC